MKKKILYRKENTLSYAEYGDPLGFPVLIQHGLIASINDYPLFNRLIESGARLINIARPGYGDSSPCVMKNIGEWADIVSALVDDLQLSQFDVFGISSGAPYSYALGYKFPDRVRNLFILSGTPALYDETVRSFWPYPVSLNASLDEMQKLARELFFSNLSDEDLTRDNIKDSMMYNGFGVAQDLQLRCEDWGFQLSEIKTRVRMRHCQSDNAVPLITAQITARLLADCQLEIRENDDHFSQEVLDDFIDTAMIGLYKEMDEGVISPFQ